MNNLLIFFALPIATVIISIALQKILKCPPLVAAVIFAIFLIVTFVIDELNFLVAAIVYAIISFITAVIVAFVCRILNELRRNGNNGRCQNNNNVNAINTNDLLTINGSYQDNGNNGVITINTLGNNGTSGVNNGGCNCNNNSTNGVSARINVIPNSSTNGRTGNLCGNYRRT